VCTARILSTGRRIARNRALLKRADNALILGGVAY
jgi:hypothetical protein